MIDRWLRDPYLSLKSLQKHNTQNYYVPFQDNIFQGNMILNYPHWNKKQRAIFKICLILAKLNKYTAITKLGRKKNRLKLKKIKKSGTNAIYKWFIYVMYWKNVFDNRISLVHLQNLPIKCFGFCLVFLQLLPVKLCNIHPPMYFLQCIFWLVHTTKSNAKTVETAFVTVLMLLFSWWCDDDFTKCFHWALSTKKFDQESSIYSLIHHWRSVRLFAKFIYKVGFALRN